MRAFFALLLLSALLVCSPAFAFDCARLDFGAKLADLDDGRFVLYRQKDGVSYYNYVGECRMAVHERANPAISYAFVDGLYFARIVRVFGEDRGRALADAQDAWGALGKATEEGDWSVFSGDAGAGRVFKLKYNNRTRESRSAIYSTRLGTRLGERLGATLGAALADGPDAPSGY